LGSFDISLYLLWPALQRVPFAPYTRIISPTRCDRTDTLVLLQVLFIGITGNIKGNRSLQQTQLAGAGDRFGAAVDLQFVENFAVMPFDRVQGQEQPLANSRGSRDPGQSVAVFLSRADLMARSGAGQARQGSDQVGLGFCAAQPQMPPAAWL